MIKLNKINVTDFKEIDRLRKASAFTMEGLNTDDENLNCLRDWFKKTKYQKCILSKVM